MDEPTISKSSLMLDQIIELLNVNKNANNVTTFNFHSFLLGVFITCVIFIIIQNNNIQNMNTKNKDIDIIKKINEQNEEIKSLSSRMQINDYVTTRSYASKPVKTNTYDDYRLLNGY
jgi:hypothetical protein